MRRAVLLLLALAFGLCAPLPAAAQQDPAVLDRINARIQSEGRARVIVELETARRRPRPGEPVEPPRPSPSSYEFRLLFINTYTVAARSPVVTVGN